MKKRLQWKSFSTFEERSDFGDELFASLTPGQRLERFFTVLELRLALGIPPKKVKDGMFVLKKENQPFESETVIDHNS